MVDNDKLSFHSFADFFKNYTFEVQKPYEKRSGTRQAPKKDISLLLDLDAEFFLDKDGKVIGNTDTYDDETTRVKKIRNSLTNEEFLYEYEGSQVSKVISGTFVAETELIGDNVIIEKKTNNNSVVSVEKTTASIVNTNIDTFHTFIDNVYKNEGSDVYLTTFIENIIQAINLIPE